MWIIQEIVLGQFDWPYKKKSSPLHPSNKISSQGTKISTFLEICEILE